jgi:Elongation factor P (EF-P) KOW-like domain
MVDGYKQILANQVQVNVNDAHLSSIMTRRYPAKSGGTRAARLLLFVLGIAQVSSFVVIPQSPLLPSSAPCLPSRRNFQSLNMVAIDTSDIKNGMTVELDDGEPYKVLSFSIMKQARGAAKTTIKFKNLMRGNTIENTYRSGEKFQTAMIERKQAQFTYQEGVCVDI